MNNKLLVFLGLIITVLLQFGCYKTERKQFEGAEWKGSIKYENGVKVVINPDEPVFGEIEFQLEEDLSIGNDKDKNFLFYRTPMIRLDGEENIYVLDRGDHRIQKFDRIDPFGKTEKKIAEFSIFGPKIIIGQGVTWTLYPNSVYRPRLLFAPLNGKGFVYGFSAEYLIYMMDSNGDPLIKIKKSETSHPISRREKEFIIDRDLDNLAQQNIKAARKTVEDACHFRDTRPFFNKIMVDDKHRIYGQRVKSVLEKAQQFGFDIFNREVYFLYKASLPCSPEIIRKDYLYDVVASDETGVIKIKRYKINNWSRFRDKTTS